ASPNGASSRRDPPRRVGKQSFAPSASGPLADGTIGRPSRCLEFVSALVHAHPNQTHAHRGEISFLIEVRMTPSSARIDYCKVSPRPSPPWRGSSGLSEAAGWTPDCSP